MRVSAGLASPRRGVLNVTLVWVEDDILRFTVLTWTEFGPVWSSWSTIVPDRGSYWTERGSAAHVLGVTSVPHGLLGEALALIPSDPARELLMMEVMSS